jgi:deoxyribose-phosphate aldolase
MPPDARAALAAAIDHTLLATTATAADIERLCREAVAHGFGAVCVNPWHLPRAAALLRGQAPVAVTVAGFPLGAAQTDVKAREAGLAVEQGAAGVDMVLNLGAFLGGELDLAAGDIRQVVRACNGAPVKVILETCLLTDEQKRLACRLAVDAGAAYVKTSTGFSRSGATEADVRLLRACVGPDIGVKASGGIKTREDALRLLAAGADRLGASASVAIIGGEA